MFRKIGGISIMPVIILMLILMGCSTSGQAVIPGDDVPSVDAGISAPAHSLWGMWQFISEPVSGSIEYVEIRNAQQHLNALRFLEPPANLFLTLESPPQFVGNKLTVDIGLRHPFLGLTKFTGFDVCGILIADASHHPYEEPGLLIGGSGDTRLLNADGYSRWWNPTEFPPDLAHPIYGYKDGLFGTPDEIADFSGILNGYKYFCDDIEGPDDPMGVIDPEGRGVFSAGQKNVRTYVISIEGGLIFNYAVDACWAQPIDNGPPVEVPDDFPENANRPEAWNVSITVEDNTLFYDATAGQGGGSAQLAIDVYDWFNAEMNIVSIYSFDGLFPAYDVPTPSSGGTGYSTYEVEIVAEPTSTDPIPILIEVASEATNYGGKLPGEAVAAYFTFELEVKAGTIEELPDICKNWGDETGCYHHWNNGQEIHDIYVQLNLASDSDGDVWMWCQRTSNALSRSKTAFNGDWGNMWEEDLMPYHGWIWIFWGNTVDVSLTPTFDGGLIAGCSAPYNSSIDNPLSIAWWDGDKWYDTDNTQWIIHKLTAPNMVAQRINGYRDSTGRFHAFCQMDGELVDFYGDEWQGDLEFVNVGQMPAGGADYACQTRTDFVAESSDGRIYLCRVEGGLKLARMTAGTTTWETIFEIDDANYDSPTIYIDSQDRVFLAARYYVSDTEDRIHLFRSEDGNTFEPDPVIVFSEPGARVDPAYLTLKGDIENHLFLTFAYRPGDDGAYPAIMASKPGGQEWTEVCVLTEHTVVNPSLAVRPDGSIEVCYGYPATYNPDDGSSDEYFNCRNYIYGRSHPGFVS